MLLKAECLYYYVKHCSCSSTNVNYNSHSSIYSHKHCSPLVIMIKMWTQYVLFNFINSSLNYRFMQVFCSDKTKSTHKIAITFISQITFKLFRYGIYFSTFLEVFTFHVLGVVLCIFISYFFLSCNCLLYFTSIA